MSDEDVDAVRDTMHYYGDTIPNDPEQLQLGDAALSRIEETETALRAVCASIAILLQERGRLPDSGPPNYALLAGAVEVYVLELEARLSRAEAVVEAAKEHLAWHGEIGHEALRAALADYEEER